MTDNGSILVTGAAGQLGAVGRTVTGLLLERGLSVRAMVRREDDRAAALRAAGAEVVTRVSDTHVPDEAYAEARATFTEKQLADLTIAVGLINAYNRLAISFRATPLAAASAAAA